MVVPDLFGYGSAAADNNHIVGPVIATFAFTATWEATRNLRWANVLLGGWLLWAPWVLGYESTLAILNDTVVGALVVALSLIKGTVHQRFGGGWRSLWQKHPAHEQEARP